MRYLLTLLILSMPLIGISAQTNTVVAPLPQNTIIEDYTLLTVDDKWHPELNAFVLTTGYQYLDADFGKFGEFDAGSLKQLNGMDHYIQLKLGGYYKNKYFEVGYHGGGNPGAPFRRDDDTGASTFGWALNASFGYAFTSKDLRWVLTPYAGVQINTFKYYSFRGKNGSKIPLDDYLSGNNHDIKFVQPSAIAGTYIDYRIFSKSDSPLPGSIYLSLGAGYLLKLQGKPDIKSAGNTLSSPGRINMNGFFANASLRFYLNEGND